MHRHHGIRVIIAGLCVGCCSSTVFTQNTDELLTTIQSVGAEGQGHREAQRAWQQLAGRPAAEIPQILTAFRHTNPLSANWLRGAVEAIADRSEKNGSDLPAEELEAFIRDTDQNPRARRLAFELLLRADETADERLIPAMLHDRSPEFRRDAVARLIQDGDARLAAGERAPALDVFRNALSGAVDDDQVKAIVAALKELGQEVDLQEHFGFLTQWQVIGPFDNRGLSGFDKAYPPEREIKLREDYKGQLDTVQWKPLATEHEYGIVDIGQQLDNYKGSAMYLTTEFYSPVEREVELRLGTPNAWKIWVNKTYLFGREEYHRGMDLDQYRVSAKFRPGRNVILVKVCQNEQPEDWAQRYQFQLRVCDTTGAGLVSRPQVGSLPRGLEVGANSGE